MNTKCKQCGWEIIELNLSEEQRLEIWALLAQDFNLFAVKKLTEYNFNLKDAKGIITHLNKDFGKCVKCNYEKIKEENTECPKCKAFNYNLKLEHVFNQEFCLHLEYKLYFDQLKNEGVKRFWCDGIDYLPSDIRSLSKSNIEEHKTIRTKAWIGEDGQSEYEMTILFGEKSVENYKKNKSLIECIPKDNYDDWIIIEPEKKKIQIQLK